MISLNSMRSNNSFESLRQFLRFSGHLNQPFRSVYDAETGSENSLKQFGDLTRDDFVEHPVWASVHTLDYDEPWYDETDEETFRPWAGKLPVSPEDGMFLVRAKLTLADGRVLDGFITPQHDSEAMDLGTIQPQAFLPSGTRCDFWDGMFKRDPKERNILYKELGVDPTSVFPMQFAAERGFAKGRVGGAISGFCWRPKDTIEVYQ